VIADQLTVGGGQLLPGALERLAEAIQRVRQ
jgi:hypothetical protein